MSRITILFIALSAAVSQYSFAKELTVEGTVMVNRLNVRAYPGKGYETVVQLNTGDKVTIKEFKNTWGGIVPPESLKVWISTSNLKDGVVTKDAEVHTGPSLAFTNFGIIPKDTKVEVIRVKQEKWAYVKGKIKGRLWVYMGYVEIPEEYRKEIEPIVMERIDREQKSRFNETDIEKANPTTKLGIPKTIVVGPPKDYSIHKISPPREAIGDLEFLGTPVQLKREGIIVEVPKDHQIPWKYALAVHVNTIFYPIVFLEDPKDLLKAQDWHRVIVTGQKQWVKGFSRPLLTVENVVKVSDENFKPKE
ncbi:MAG: hypothetical protein MK193_03950 [Lentisphaeria bacterium]|nr:hypothetical protein [Lentisphaeria bacterium]